MKRICAVILSIIFMLLMSACSKDFVGIESVFAGSNIPFKAEMVGKNAQKAFDEMLELIEHIDKEVSLTRTDSTMYYFNETAQKDEKVKISAHTYNMIQIALKAEQDSAGAFSIAAHNLSVLWRLHANGLNNYDGGEKYDAMLGAPLSFTLPTLNEVREVLAYSSTSILSVYDNEQDGSYYISKSDARLRLDFGAIAKGYCVDEAFKILQKHEIQQAIIDLSGNLYIYNLPDEVWVRVAAPRPRFAILGREVVCGLIVKENTSIVTSGDYQRYYLHESGITACHIVDPRSGLPAGVEYIGSHEGSENMYRMKQSWVSSVSVINSSSALADAYSTAAFVLGINEGIEFLNAQSTRGIMFADSPNEDVEQQKYMATAGDVVFVDETEALGYKEYTAL